MDKILCGKIKDAVRGEMDYLEDAINDRLWEIVRPIVECLETEDGIIEEEIEYMDFAREVFFKG